MDVQFRSGDAVEAMRLLAAGGLTFNGDTAAANALDDYEEGTWTPLLDGTSSTPSLPTYATQVGKYTKIGNIVSIQMTLILNGKGTCNGFLRITGLPFAVGTAGVMASTSMSRMSIGDHWRGKAWVYDNASICYLIRQKQSTDTSDVQMATADYTLNSQILFNCTYTI